jgi:transmembrane sensor
MTMTNYNSSDSIKNLIARFLEGTATQEEAGKLRTWLEESELNRQHFDEINQAFQTAFIISNIDQLKTDQNWNELQSRIDGSTVTEKGKASLEIWHLSPLKIAAAIGLIIVSCYTILTFNAALLPEKQATLISKAEGKNTHFLLPDGSEVWLNKNSILEYPSSFEGSSRTVVLKGEAFFDVKKNGKPFIVQTENVQVFVKGTRFNVQAYNQEAAVKTTLEEGKVELHLTGSDTPYEMKPGDQIILNKSLNQVTLKEVDPANFTAWKEERLVFDNTPLNEIITKLENRYRVAITVQGVIANRERLTMTIENESLEEVLESVRLSSQLKVRAEGKRYIIYQ